MKSQNKVGLEQIARLRYTLTSNYWFVKMVDNVVKHGKILISLCEASTSQILLDFATENHVQLAQQSFLMGWQIA